MAKIEIKVGRKSKRSLARKQLFEEKCGYPNAIYLKDSGLS